jgi:hypothetical protein
MASPSPSTAVFRVAIHNNEEGLGAPQPPGLLLTARETGVTYGQVVVTLLPSRVTAPIRASALPISVAPVPKPID